MSRTAILSHELECVIVTTEAGCPWVELTASWRSARSSASALGAAGSELSPAAQV
jgi:hypothetical protein